MRGKSPVRAEQLFQHVEREEVLRLVAHVLRGEQQRGRRGIERRVGTRLFPKSFGTRQLTSELLGDFDPDPAIQSNRIHVVLARGCTPDGERDQDDGEDVSVRLASVDEVRELIRRGRIRHAAAISAWYYYESVGERRGLG